jgi:hypothetical protein
MKPKNASLKNPRPVRPALLGLSILLLGTVAAHTQTLNNFYVMDNNSNNELLYIVTIDDPFNLAGSSFSVGSAISMDSQLSGDFRSIELLTDGRLVVESVNANRLSYWDADGNYDTASGQFGGNALQGVAALYDGTFVAQNIGAGGTGTYRVYQNAATTEAYTVSLNQQDGTTPAVTSYDRLTGRAGGGLVVGSANNSSALVSVYNSSGSPVDTVLSANVSADVSPNATDTGFMAPLAGGWATRSAGVAWYAYSELTDGSGNFPGSFVSGTVGGRIVDIAPFGEEYTAALFMNTSFAPTTNGNAFIQVWDNLDLASGPLRTLDLGFNLAEVSQNWNNSRLSGPVIVPEPRAAALVPAGLALVGWVMWRRHRRRAVSEC